MCIITCIWKQEKEEEIHNAAFSIATCYSCETQTVLQEIDFMIIVEYWSQWYVKKYLCYNLCTSSFGEAMNLVVGGSILRDWWCCDHESERYDLGKRNSTTLGHNYINKHKTVKYAD